MRWSTLARLAMAGTKTDRVRVAMTAFGTAAAVFAWLCAATVASLGALTSQVGSDPRYSSDLIAQPGLRPGVIITFILLTIPVLGFVGQCARLGAPTRDRRLASMRLAGATPRQAIAIGAGESGFAALAGSVLGLAVFLILRQVLDHADANGRRALPTDVRPPTVVIAIICLVLPAVVAVVSAWVLRSVIVTPLGVIRRVRRTSGPSPWVGVLLVVGLTMFALFGPLIRYLSRHEMSIPTWVAVTVFYIGVLSASIGIAVGAGWIAYAAGRTLRRYSRSPAGRLAGGRLIADPWQGSRAFGVLMIAVLFAGAIAGVYSYFTTMDSVNAASDRASAAAEGLSDSYDTTNPFYTQTALLAGIAVGIAAIVGALALMVSLAESIVSRRRTYAALVASGVPRSVLVRTQIWQTLSMAVPALILATATGDALARALFGTRFTGYSSTNDQGGMLFPPITQAVPIPWTGLGVVLAGSVAAVLVTIGIGLLFLKPSTSVEELRTA